MDWKAAGLFSGAPFGGESAAGCSDIAAPPIEPIITAEAIKTTTRVIIAALPANLRGNLWAGGLFPRRPCIDRASHAFPPRAIKLHGARAPNPSPDRSKATNDEPRIPASCRCGKVELQITGGPILRGVCYCASCQEAGRRHQAPPGADAVVAADGGTDYVLYCKDRVRCVQGGELLKSGG
jgi:hypothetical protein